MLVTLVITNVPQDTDSFTPSVNERTLQAQLQELMCYVWDNYLQLYDSAEDIFLMGVGNAYLGIKVLLINRGTADPGFYFLQCRSP